MLHPAPIFAPMQPPCPCFREGKSCIPSPSRNRRREFSWAALEPQPAAIGACFPLQLGAICTDPGVFVLIWNKLTAPRAGGGKHSQVAIQERFQGGSSGKGGSWARNWEQFLWEWGSASSAPGSPFELRGGAGKGICLEAGPEPGDSRECVGREGVRGETSA